VRALPRGCLLLEPAVLVALIACSTQPLCRPAHMCACAVHRASLAMVYLLVDCSIPPQKVDLQYATWLRENKVPFSIVFTKVGCDA